MPKMDLTHDDIKMYRSWNAYRVKGRPHFNKDFTKNYQEVLHDWMVYRRRWAIYRKNHFVSIYVSIA